MSKKASHSELRTWHVCWRRWDFQGYLIRNTACPLSERMQPFASIPPEAQLFLAIQVGMGDLKELEIFEAIIEDNTGMEKSVWARQHRQDP
jgi:hypothetical protein